MDISQETPDGSASPYEFESLSSQNQALLSHICEWVSPKSLKNSSINTSVDMWDGASFKQYVNNVPDVHKQSFRDMVEKEVRYQSTFSKINLEGVKAESALHAFCCSAQAQKIPLTQFLKEYIQFCNRIEFKPRGFNGHEETIRTLLATGETGNRNKDHIPSDPEKLSLQDTNLINDEIEKIKSDLKYYPYVKDEIVKLDNHEVELALQRVDQLLKAAPENIELLALKSTLLSQLKKLGEAYELSASLYERNPENLQVVLSYLRVLIKQRKLEKALAVCARAKDEFQYGPSVFFYAGMAYMYLSNTEKAIEEFIQASKMDEEYLTPLFYLAHCYSLLGNLEKSEFVLKKALRIFPEDVNVMFDLMKCLGKQGKEDEAKQYVESLKINNKGEILPLYILVMEELKENNIYKAKKIMKEYLIELKDDPFETKERISNAYSQTAKLFDENFNNSTLVDMAKECYEIAIGMDSKNEEAIKGKIRIDYFSGEYESARESLYYLSDLIFENRRRRVQVIQPFLELSAEARRKGMDFVMPLKWCVEKLEDCIDCHLALAQECYLNEEKEETRLHLEKALEISETYLDQKEIPLHIAHNFYALGKGLLLTEDRWPQGGEYEKRASALFQNCIHENIKSNDFSLWLNGSHELLLIKAQNGLDGKDSEILFQCINGFKQLIKECSRIVYTDLWISLNETLSAVFERLWTIERKDDYFESAIEYRKSVLQELTLENDRNRWLANTRALAGLLFSRWVESSHENSLVEAIECYRSLIVELDKERDFSLLMESEVSLGNALLKLHEVDLDLSHLEGAKNCYARVCEYDDTPYHTEAIVGVGNCLLALGKSTEDIGVLKEGVIAFEEVLKSLRKDKDAAYWGYVQGQLGLALQTVGFLQDENRYLIDSIEAFKLEIGSLQDTTDEYDMYNLSIALSNKGLSEFVLYERTSNQKYLINSIKDFTDSLSSFTIENTPYAFANSHDCLGDAYCYKGEYSGDPNDFKSSLYSFNQSLRVNTKLNDPEKYSELLDKVKKVNMKLDGST